MLGRGSVCRVVDHNDDDVTAIISSTTIWHGACGYIGLRRAQCGKRVGPRQITISMGTGLNGSLELIQRLGAGAKNHLKNLHILRGLHESQIEDILLDDILFSSIRQAFGSHLYDPNEVITHRSVLSYRIERILHGKGIRWPTDPCDLGVTETLLEVRKRVLDRLL